jgi:hypothetical protein
MIFLASLTIFTSSFGQTSKRTVVTEKFVAPSIQGNPAGENALRRLTIYLPPGYHQRHLLCRHASILYWRQFNH